MQSTRPPTDAPPPPIILDRLPDFPVPKGVCPRRTRMQIDLILLAIEALEVTVAPAIVQIIEQLQLQTVIPSRVALWQLRSANPLRRFSQRRTFSLEEAKALVLLAHSLCKRLTVVVRQLAMDCDRVRSQNLPLDKEPRLAYYLQRFRTHFRSRMNPRRSAIVAYSNDDKLNELAANLLLQLLFCTGTAGAQRLWVAVLDGEILDIESNLARMKDEG